VTHEARTNPDRAPEEAPVGYEPPRVERVLMPADLEREILYAGDEESPAVDGAL
jgi:hypothetical protein